MEVSETINSKKKKQLKTQFRNKLTILMFFQITYPSHPHLNSALIDDVASNTTTRLKNVDSTPESDLIDSESSPSISSDRRRAFLKNRPPE